MEVKLRNLQLTINLEEGTNMQNNLEFFKALDDSDFNLEYEFMYIKKSGLERDLFIVKKDNLLNVIQMSAFRKATGNLISLKELSSSKITKILELRLHLTNIIESIDEEKWESIKESTRRSTSMLNSFYKKIG